MKIFATIVGVALIVVGCNQVQEQVAPDRSSVQTADLAELETKKREELQKKCRHAIDRLQASFQIDVNYIPGVSFDRHASWINDTVKPAWDEALLVDEFAGPFGEYYRYSALVTLAGKTESAGGTKQTVYGTLMIQLMGPNAPDLVRNFLALARTDFYQGKPLKGLPEAPELPFAGTTLKDDPYVFKASRNFNPPPSRGRHVPIPHGSLLAICEDTTGTDELIATKLFLNPYNDIDEDWHLQNRYVVFGIATETGFVSTLDLRNITAKKTMAAVARGMAEANTTVFIQKIEIARETEALRYSTAICLPEILEYGVFDDSHPSR